MPGPRREAAERSRKDIFNRRLGVVHKAGPAECARTWGLKALATTTPRSADPAKLRPGELEWNLIISSSPKLKDRTGSC